MCASDMRFNMVDALIKASQNIYVRMLHIWIYSEISMYLFEIHESAFFQRKKNYFRLSC